MEKLSVYHDSFQEALYKMEKVLIIVLIRSQKYILALSDVKFHMLQIIGIILGHLISCERIYVDPLKIQVILKLQILRYSKDVISFLGLVGYYR